MHPTTRSCYLFVVAFAVPQAAQAEWISITTKSYQHIVVGKSMVIASSHSESLRLDHHGNVIEHLALPHSDPDDYVSTRKTDEKILDDLGLRDIDHDTPRAMAMLENEQTLADRRHVSPKAPADDVIGRRLFQIVIADDQLWTATKQGLFYWNFKRSKQILPGPFVGPFSLASAYSRVLFASGTRLIFWDLEHGPLWDRTQKDAILQVALSANGKQAAWLSATGVTLWHEFNKTYSQTVLQEFSHANDIGFCGEVLLILMENQLVALSENGTQTTQVLPQSAHHVACMNGKGGTWILYGKDLLRSADGGRQWQRFPLPPFTRIRDMAVTPFGAFISSSEGLSFCSWSTWSSTLPFTPSIEIQSNRRVKPKVTGWYGHLPRISLHGQYRQTIEKHDFRTLLFATFPLDHPTHFQVAANQDQRDDFHGVSPVTDVHTALSSTQNLGQEYPCLHQTRRKAIEIFLVEPERAHSYLRRSAHAAWLPELRVMVDRRFGRSESLDYMTTTGSLSSPLGVDTVNDVRYEARATWDLAKIIFSHEELAAQSQALRMAEHRRDIELNVHRLFFERQRLQLEPMDDSDQVSRKALRLSEITAELDALSDNAFTRCLGHP